MNGKIKQKEIILDGKKIIYTLQKKVRLRYMRLSLNQCGAVRLRVPWLTRESVAEDFLLQKTRWILEKLEILKERISLIPAPCAKDYKKNKDLAREIILAKLEHFNESYGFSWKGISVRNQKSRWGSCSRNGKLNFSYRIIYLPEKLCDFVVIHELCHLEQFNHSENFWKLVEKTIPDWKKIRRELRKF